MRPILLLGSACCIGFAANGPAQEAPPPSDVTVAAEIREIRQLIEQQNRQLDALSRQFSALKDFVTSNGALQPVAGKPGEADPAPVRTPTSKPTAAASNPGVSAGTSPATANLAPTPNAPGKHTVAKGETLTSIAKRYNIPLA